MEQDLLKALGMRHPVIQAPMAGVSTPQMAAAVSGAGGLGSLALGASSIDQARALIEQTRALTDRPVNFNLFCHQVPQRNPALEANWLATLAPLFGELNAEAPEALKEPYPSFLADPGMLDLLLSVRPKVVSFHFGLPSAGAIQAFKASGTLLLASVTSLAEAEQAQAAGIDALVAQGIEAGGHRGVFDPAKDNGLGTLALVRLLAARSPLPIIAAGGIMDGAGIRAALNLGACAAQLGTAFILCPESAANDSYRAALQSGRAHHTAFTSAISGRPARGLPNRFWKLAGKVPDYPVAYHAGKALVAAAQAAGNPDFAVQWAGQGAPLARALPAAKLVKTLAAELGAL
ncbi:nitronate monooxygenase [Gallaecimonas kandeliae]|uniref:NAD(P)H-dependent flavin oxidoreductase n=1 Tax=Gallaecimonas kandeliae TaxID=3029055 RepID=UPI0026474FFF|nr:nitronate monooxygenase [Gallaecimonas kandeliae]WKE64786.1 nitronate monooxygenase [Gallaecimonas kandeliae]